MRIFGGIAVVIVLLASGLMLGNLASRQNAMIPLLWLHALLPLVVSGWVLAGLPGVPQALLHRRRRQRSDPATAGHPG